MTTFIHSFYALHSYLILSTLLSFTHFTCSLLTMAETLANELLKVLVKKMTDEAFKRIARAQGIHNELKELKKTLSRIQDLLNDASQKEVTHKSVKSWLNALQHLAYDIDDVLDDVATEAMRRELTLQEPEASTSMHFAKKVSTLNERLWQCKFQEHGVKLGQSVNDISDLFMIARRIHYSKMLLRLIFTACAVQLKKLKKEENLSRFLQINKTDPRHIVIVGKGTTSTC
ncbi:putative virus X resistance protein-like, coiled-coil [Helianthus annuus]|nr:putative virus X resistance protein-like, coiled-coil [Helianthus annuus]